MMSCKYMNKNKIGSSTKKVSGRIGNIPIANGTPYVGTFSSTLTCRHHIIFVLSNQQKSPLSPRGFVSTTTRSTNAAHKTIVLSNIPVPHAMNAIPSHDVGPDLLHTENRKTRTLPNNKPKQNLPTPINVTLLQHLLQGYDTQKTKYIINGFTQGFRLNFEGIEHQFTAKNSPSALSKPSIVSQKNSRRN